MTALPRGVLSGEASRYAIGCVMRNPMKIAPSNDVPPQTCVEYCQGRRRIRHSIHKGRPSHWKSAGIVQAPMSWCVRRDLLPRITGLNASLRYICLTAAQPRETCLSSRCLRRQLIAKKTPPAGMAGRVEEERHGPVKLARKSARCRKHCCQTLRPSK